MFDFRKLLKLLERELSQQERLLGVLAKERAAIVKLNQDQLDEISETKAQLLADMVDLENRRKEIFTAIALGAKREDNLRFSEVVEMCPPHEGRGQLKHIGENLKKIATEVKSINDQNTLMIKQSLGLITSTIAIIRSAPESDLPTYTPSGTLTSTSEDPAFTASKNQISREA